MIQKLFLFVFSLFFNFFSNKKLLLYTFLFTALGLGSGYGQTNTWTGSTSTAWNTATNWSLNLVPIAAHDVVIPNVSNKPIISGVGAACNNLTINSSSSLTVSESLTVSGTTSVSGTLTVGSATGTETKQFTGLVTINSGGIWNNAANSAIDFRGGITNNGTFTSGTGIQTFSTNAQSLVGSITINSATITGITLNNSGALTISTALLGTGTLINSSGNTLAIGGTCSINTLINAGTNTISGAGTISTTLANFVNTGILNLNGSGTIAGITNNAGGTANLSGSGTITSFNNATATSVLQITAASPSITTLTATIAGNTVNYSGASQTIKGTTYSNLILSGSGTKTLGAITTVSGNWSMVAGTLANLSGFTNTAGTLVLGGAGPLLSSWGSTTSGATNTTNDYFTGTGRINVSSAPYPAIDNNYASYTSGVTGQVAGTQGEYANPPTNTLPGSLTLSAPAGSAFINVKFASYGSPGGTSPNFTIGSCHAFNSRTVTTGLLGQNIATIPASGSFNATFGDPCYGIVKSYNVVATYAEPFCTTSGVPAIVINGSTPTGGNGTYSYLWEKSTTGHSTGYAAAPGTNNAKDYTVPVGTSQTTWFRRTVTSGIYSDATIVIVQVVTGPPTVPTAFTSVTSCPGTTTLSVSGGSIGGLGGYVEFATGSCGGTVVGTSNSIPATLVVSPTVGNTTYYVRYKNACGNTTCLSTVATNSVSITATASATAVCFNTASQNASLAYTATTGTPTLYSIVWDPAAITAGLINQTDTSFAFVATGGTLNTISIPANVPAGTYTGILTVKNGSGCVSFKNNFTVTINPKPTVTNSSLTQTICSGGSSALVTLTSGVAGTTFAWTATATAGVSGFTASGTSTIPVQTISTAGTTQGTITYVITPTANGCPGTSTNYTILVNPVPTVTNSSLTQTICSGGSSALVTLTSGVAGTTFAWTATATAGVSGFTASGTSTIPVQTISVTGTTQGTITYVITPTANGCPGTSTNYTILVNPVPTVTNSSLTQTICSGGNSALVTLTSGVAGTTFAWTASATAGVSGFTASGTSTIPVQTISTTGTTQGTVTYVITPTANGCSGASSVATFTITPSPTISDAGVDQSGNNSFFTLSANTATVGTGAWSIASGPSMSLSQFSSTANPTATFTPAVSGTYVLNWTISNACGSSSDQVVIGNCVSNLISNGSFNSSTANWTYATSLGFKVEVNPENTYFATSNSNFTAELDTEASLRQVITVVPGVSYTVSFLYGRRPGAPATSGVTVKIIDGATAIISPNLTTTSTIPQVGSFTFTPTSSSIGVEFYNTLHGNLTLGTIIDDIVLIPTSQVVPRATTTPKGTFNTSTSCAGVPVQLDVDNITASGVTYAWTGSAGAVFSPSANIKNPTVTFTGSGIQQATVIATSAGGCSNSSTTYVNVNALLTAYAVTGGGSYCSGGTGVTVGLANSVSGVNYQLQIGGVNTGSAVAGTGSSISFGLKTTVGTYTVVATNAATTCTSNMTGSVAVSISALPTAYAVTGGGSYCSGGNGVLVGLANSTSGVNYQLQIGGVNTGSAVAGTGSSISFGLQTAAGTYTVLAKNAATTCTSNMTGSVTVSINALPTAPTVGTITNVSCSAGGSVVLNGLPGGIWTINQSGTATASYSSNTSSYMVTGLAAGSYTFRVTNANGCTSSATAVVPITDTSSTTWNGVAWSNGVPDATKNAIIVSVTPNSPFTADLSACALTINNSSGVVTVPSGITLTITNEVTVSTDYNLVFENNASLVQINNATNSGKIIYKRNSAAMKNFDYTYWSSPVAGQTLFNLSPNTLSDKYMSFSGTGWQISYGGTAVMQPGIGYIIRTPKNGTWPAPHPEVVVFPYSQPVQFKGVPNNGNITSGQPMIKDNFYLIGNPYPSALFADDFLSGNNAVLNGTIYLWTHNTAISSLKYTSDDYASYNGLGGVATSGGAKPSGYIAAGQSFFASAKANGNAVFNNSMRAGGNNNAQFFKPGKTAKTAGVEKHRLWLDMTNTAGAFKQTLIGYAEGATNNFDDNFDGLTFDGNSYLDLYSINGTDNLTIQGRALPFVDTDLVPLGYRSTVAGSFTIAINQADGILANQRVYLEDKQTNTINDLTAQNYTFSTTAGTFNNRFVLRYTSNTLGTGGFETIENSITVLSQDKMIIISSPKENIDKVFVYDVSGKQLYKKQSVGHVELSIQHLPFAQQVLLVKVVLENGYTTTKKLIFK